MENNGKTDDDDDNDDDDFGHGRECKVRLRREKGKKSANAYGNAVALDTSCDVLGEQDQ